MVLLTDTRSYSVIEMHLQGSKNFGGFQCEHECMQKLLKSSNRSSYDISQSCTVVTEILELERCIASRLMSRPGRKV